MNIANYRNTLIVAGVAAALGIGAAGCTDTTDDRVADERASDAPYAETTPRTETTPRRDTTVASDQRNAGDSSLERAGDDASQAASDTWITTKVKSALLADSDAEGLNVGVDTKNGVVSLEGELASQADIDHVKTLVGDVEGVRRIDANALTVSRQ